MIWDLRGGFKLQKLQAHQEAVTSLGVLNDLLFSAGVDRTLRIWDVKEGKLLRSVKVH